MNPNLSAESFRALLQTVFQLQPEEKGITILFDIPGNGVEDTAPWSERREIACEWYDQLRKDHWVFPFSSITLGWYTNVGSNNNDLPDQLWLSQGDVSLQALPKSSQHPFAKMFRDSSVILALTQFSATAPLKIAAKASGFRGASMPGFSREMMPSLGLDYEEVHQRVVEFKEKMDAAEGLTIEFTEPSGDHTLYVDLRFRTGHASGGLMREKGDVGNLPSGEAYIVPYEGEREGISSKTDGIMPVQFGKEVVLYRIEKNRAVAVISSGPMAREESKKLEMEPAYGNIAEIGIGVLGEWGVHAVGSTLLDEKLGPHIAFGRSEHFGGVTGPQAFRKKENVVHIDRVYVPSTQPDISIHKMTFHYPPEKNEVIMIDSKYTV